MDPDELSQADEPLLEAEAEPRVEPERTPYLGFLLGADIYGLPLHQLREVAHVAHLRRVPGAPAGVAGLVNLRGEILCALDVRTILGLEQPRVPVEAPFLVALRGFPEPLGLIVDSIADIYAVAADDIEPIPAAWPPDRAACFTGATRVPAGLMGLLDLNQVIKV